MIKNLVSIALSCILLIFILLYSVNPGAINKFTETISLVTNISIFTGITIWLLIKIVAIIIATYIGSKIISFILKKTFNKTPFPEKIEDAIISFSKILTWAIGFFVALGTVGIDLTALIVGIGAFSIAISFATRDVVQNLVSGALLYSGKPFKIGDRIKIRNFEGIVKKIGIRSTVLKEDDGDLITIPNTMLVTNPVKKIRGERKVQKK